MRLDTKNNAAASYLNPVKKELRKSAGLLSFGYELLNFMALPEI